MKHGRRRTSRGHDVGLWTFANRKIQMLKTIDYGKILVLNLTVSLLSDLLVCCSWIRTKASVISLETPETQHILSKWMCHASFCLCLLPCSSVRYLLNWLHSLNSIHIPICGITNRESSSFPNADKKNFALKYWTSLIFYNCRLWPFSKEIIRTYWLLAHPRPQDITEDNLAFAIFGPEGTKSGRNQLDYLHPV